MIQYRTGSIILSVLLRKFILLKVAN